MIECKVLQERGGWWEDILTNRCIFPIAPINTFSNLAYVIIGALTYTLKPSLASAVMALAFAFLGVGSGLYHGTKRGWASKLDHAGMYAAFTSIVTYTLAPTNRFIGPLMALVAALVAWRLAYTTSTKDLLNPMMGVFIAISTLSVGLNGDLKFALISFGLFCGAYVIWWMDKSRTFLFKHWGHGLWHIITAIAMGLLYFGRVS